LRVAALTGGGPELQAASGITAAVHVMSAIAALLYPDERYLGEDSSREGSMGWALIGSFQADGSGQCNLGLPNLD
jgi:hypothetical protein